VEAGKRLVRVNLDGQVDFLAGMRVQQMQTELDEALTFGTMPLSPYRSECEQIHLTRVLWWVSQVLSSVTTKTMRA
jgi:hypothetical protein